MSDLLITNGRVIDPSQELDQTADVLIRDGSVLFVGAHDDALSRSAPDAEIIDAAGCVVTPGLIDMHVHFREPGMEEEETILSGAAAAVAGGFTSVACMPNTDPPLDSEAAIAFMLSEARKANAANVFPVGCITARRQGKELAEMGQMARGGAVAFSDDGASVPSAGLLRRAMNYAKMLDMPILEHCEDESLAAGGLMHEGYVSTVLGLAGIPAEAEEIMVARDIALARLTGCRLHIQHISTAGSVELVRRAKENDLRVTAEVAPHHLVLTHEAVRGYDPNFKVNPPLRTQADVDACVSGLRSGIIDVIASDHAPHLVEEKELQFSGAPCGMLGLETSLGVLLTYLVEPGKVELARIIQALTVRPAAILGIERGSLKTGMSGDVTILDPGEEWTVDAQAFRSKSRNCPFHGQTLRGRAVAAIVNGEVKFSVNEKNQNQ